MTLYELFRTSDNICKMSADSQTSFALYLSRTHIHIMPWLSLQLRFDYDTTTKWLHARLLPFESTRAKNEHVNFSSLSYSRIVVESQLWYRLKSVNNSETWVIGGQFTSPKGHISVMIAWSVRVTVRVRVIGLGLGTLDHSDPWPYGPVTLRTSDL